ncbi:uncharacterized protein ARMOST_14369 [Armillaria ostoyae]|uniref:Uncharacterized protein n=1 Tax=Armillaria ostoyae TaxID=47428 RepID=A0A284RQE1_ARMOS|nr:uncharacterized protein ARMOST_14369 [Armillaria ostoyae]
MTDDRVRSTTIVFTAMFFTSGARQQSPRFKLSVGGYAHALWRRRLSRIEHKVIKLLSNSDGTEYGPCDAVVGYHSGERHDRRNVARSPQHENFNFRGYHPLNVRSQFPVHTCGANELEYPFLCRSRSTNARYPGFLSKSLRA